MIWATDRTVPDFLYPWQTGHKEQYHIPRRVRARGTWITERRWRKAVCECEHKSFSPIAAGQFSRLQANAECAWWHSLNNTRWDATSFHHKPRVRNLRLQFFMHTEITAEGLGPVTSGPQTSRRSGLRLVYHDLAMRRHKIPWSNVLI